MVSFLEDNENLWKYIELNELMGGSIKIPTNMTEISEVALI